MATAYNVAFGSPWPWIANLSANGGFALGTQDLGTQNTGIAVTMALAMGDTITDIGYRQGVTTGTPSAGSHTISLQTIAAGGKPSGTAVGGVTKTTFTPAAANDGTWVWVNLGANTYTITQGQEFAIVLERTAATDASNKITAGYGGLADIQSGFPAISLNATGVGWAVQTGAGTGMMGIKSASNTYGRPFQTVAAAQTFGNTTEIGNTFTIPSTFFSTAKLRGIRALIQTPASDATASYVATLYSSPTSSPARVDQTIALSNDRWANASRNWRMVEMYFTSSTVINSGTEYGIALATKTAGDGGLYAMDVTAAADWDAWEFRQQAAYMSRTASSYAGITAGTATGNFAKTTTRRSYIDFLLDDISFTGGTAGMLYVPDLAGT